MVWPEILDGRIGPGETARTLAGDIARSVPGTTVSVGIGSLCRDLAGYAHSYAETRYCLEVLHRFGNTNRTLSVEELGLQCFLLRARDDAELLTFAHRRLDLLLEHDRQHSVQLLKTLRVYVLNECSLVKTARQMVLHVNSIQYHLRRIEHLSGVRVCSPEGLMELQLALLIASLDRAAFPELEPQTPEPR